MYKISIEYKNNQGLSKVIDELYFSSLQKANKSYQKAIEYTINNYDLFGSEYRESDYGIAKITKIGADFKVKIQQITIQKKVYNF